MTSIVDHGEVLVEEFLDISKPTNEEMVYNQLYPVYAIALLKALQAIQQEHGRVVSR